MTQPAADAEPTLTPTAPPRAAVPRGLAHAVAAASDLVRAGSGDRDQLRFRLRDRIDRRMGRAAPRPGTDQRRGTAYRAARSAGAGSDHSSHDAVGRCVVAE